MLRARLIYPDVVSQHYPRLGTLHSWHDQQQHAQGLHDHTEACTPAGDHKQVPKTLGERTNAQALPRLMHLVSHSVEMSWCSWTG